MSCVSETNNNGRVKVYVKDCSSTFKIVYISTNVMPISTKLGWRVTQYGGLGRGGGLGGGWGGRLPTIK